jgi:hypothetical protein
VIMHSDNAVFSGKTPQLSAQDMFQWRDLVERVKGLRAGRFLTRRDYTIN